MGYKGVVDVNESLVKQKSPDILVSLALKSKSISFKGLLTQEIKIRAIQNWVGHILVI
ncbi:hypothetical protein ALNOE001_12610 [Candidatus Methanobinarius endosymbioticus]|uniref:Uncharacterized protein n=1 Tax=Candidatus Methanobinarius endosymbioticus TaxID=2006182 RepID=A0A366MBT4_9EURY|nr:hypothetical protein ALNOE001_12610 [Candidatus Methanobinarius endosymbioticus]